MSVWSIYSNISESQTGDNVKKDKRHKITNHTVEYYTNGHANIKKLEGRKANVLNEYNTTNLQKQILE